MMLVEHSLAGRSYIVLNIYILSLLIVSTLYLTNHTCLTNSSLLEGSYSTARAYLWTFSFENFMALVKAKEIFGLARCLR